jgi:hypothetical protein
MEKNNNKSRLVMVITAVITFVISTWLISNWDDFKAGLAGEPQPQAKSHP